MQDLPFYIAWAFTSLYSTLHMCWLMSGDGKVDNVGRVLIVVSWVPLLSFVMAFCLFVIGVLFFICERLNKWWNSPKMVTWRINRKIRKPWRGPLVRIVEAMHKFRETRRNENEIPEA